MKLKHEDKVYCLAGSHSQPSASKLRGDAHRVVQHFGKCLHEVLLQHSECVKRPHLY